MSITKIFSRQTLSYAVQYIYMDKKLLFSKTEILTASFIAALFIIAAYYSTMYQDAMRTFIDAHDTSGILVYIASTIIATIIAPVSATPLIPIAATAWGPVAAAIYSIIGWTLGAVFAFWISRKYGYRYVRRLVKLRKIQEYAEHIPERNLFWSVIFMRLALPVDILSYALGLFSTMPFWSYVVATIIGTTPFAFVFAYTSQMPIWFQVLVLVLTGILIYFAYQKIREEINYK